MVELLLVREPAQWADVAYQPAEEDGPCAYDLAASARGRLQLRLGRLPRPIHRRVARVEIAACEDEDPTLRIAARCDVLEEMAKRAPFAAAEGYPMPPDLAPDACAPRVLDGLFTLPTSSSE